MTTFRLMLDPPRSASLNMAIDEALMRSRAVHGPVLRFYGWEEPSITAGYFQNVEQVARRFGAEKKGIPVVRRLSGGGAVLHGQDLTFSLCLSHPNDFFPTDVKSSYLKINEAVRVGLQNNYPGMDYADCRTISPQKKQGGERVCFDAPACYDLLMDGKKILGSSQRRMHGTLLHQASLFLGAEHETLIKLIVRGFEENWGIRFENSELTESERGSAERIERSRYFSSEWALFRERSFFS